MLVFADDVALLGRNKVELVETLNSINQTLT